MAASPILGKPESFYVRDRTVSQAKRKWVGKQLNLVSEPGGTRKDGLLASGYEGVRDLVKRKSTEKLEGRGRQISLRYVKNSTEVLRQRSAKRAGKDTGVDGTSGAREGRQFTVANVGNNGKIYLR